MARRKRTFAGEIAQAVNESVSAAVAQALLGVEPAVQEIVARHFGIPTGDDMVEAHVAKLVTRHRATKAPTPAPAKRKSPKAKAKASTKKVAKRKAKSKAAKASPKKRQAKKKQVARKASGKKNGTRKKIRVAKATNGSNGSTYKQLRDKVLSQKAQAEA